MGGFVSDAVAFVNLAMSLGAKVAGEIGNIQRKIAEVQQKYETKMQKIRTIRNEIKRKTDHIFQMKKIFFMTSAILLIGKCFALFGDLFGKLFKWAFRFVAWFFNDFIKWFIQFVTCTIQKILHIPKCFMWYGLDTAGWIFYLPFRFLFWLLDQLLFSGVDSPNPDDPNADPYGGPIVTAEHQVWKYLYQLDNTIHDGFGTGFHIAHFPDSVMETCYSCKIDPYPHGPTFPYKEIEKFIKCILTPFKFNIK